MADGGATALQTGVRNTPWMLDPEADQASTNGNSRGGIPQEVRLAALGPPAFRDAHELLDVAEQRGDRTAAAAAISIFRAALEVSLEDPWLHNGLGIALMVSARLEPQDAALQSIRAATNEFEAAVVGAAPQNGDPAARIRYRVNLGTALWILGEREGKKADIERGEGILRAVIEDLPRESLVRWPQALDSLGNALMALDRPNEAIPSYEEALRCWQDVRGRAQTLTNLGTAYTRTGLYREACGCYEEALAVQTPEQQPLAWSRAKHNLGTTLWLEAHARPPSQTKRAELRDAVEALETARRVRESRAPVDCAITAANLSTALFSLGLALYGEPQPDPRSGAAQIERGISLGKAALAALTPADVMQAAGNLSVILDEIKFQKELPALNFVLDTQIDILITAHGISHNDLIQTSLLQISSTLFEIHSLLFRDTIDPGMDRISIHTRILDVLAYSGKPREEWPDILHGLINQIRPEAGATAVVGTARDEGHVATGSAGEFGPGDAATAKKGDCALPELPPGLHWPTENFSGSPEAKRGGGGIITYLDRVWLDLIKAGVADLRTLRDRDPSALIAIKNFTRTNPRTGQRRQLPTRLHFPTLKEMNDRALAVAAPGLASNPRLARVVINRAKRGAKVLG